MGDLHRVIRAKDKKFSDPGFEMLLRVNPEKLSRVPNPFFKRPAYQYTKAEVGRVPNLQRTNNPANL